MNPFVIIISFCVGLFLVNSMSSKLKIIEVEPTLDNSEKVVYTNLKTKKCFKLKSKKIKCPQDMSNVIDDDDDTDEKSIDYTLLRGT